MLKRLFQEVKEFKRASILAPLCMVGEVVLELMLPFLMSFIIDKGIKQSDMQQVLLYGGMMLIIAFGSMYCGVMSGKHAAYASAGFAKNLRHALFGSVQKFSFRNMDRYSTAGLVTRLMTDVTNVQNAYQMILRMCVRAPLTLIVAMCMTFYINASLAVIFLYAAIFLGVALAFITVKAYPVFDRVFSKYDDLNASVQENVTNIRVVKAYVKEDAEISKFKSASLHLYEMFCKAENILVFNSPLMQLTVYSCMIAISWLGAELIVSGSMQTGELMSMFTYTMSILMSLMMLSMIFVMLTMSMASVKRIVEVLNESSDLNNPDNPIMEVKDGSIRFDHVSFGYQEGEEHEVLHDINLEIPSGMTVGILGATGSSKTTMVNLIARLYDTTAGTVLVGGEDVKRYDLDVLRKEVAMVLQKNVLFSGTIEENLKWANPDLTMEQMQEACRIAQADEFIQAMPDGYQTYIERGGTNVSGGQKQRLCLARAILRNPKILILDDSTSAVDTRTDALIREGMRQTLPETTKLIISQRISSIESADLILVLDEGRIHGCGTHEELLQSDSIYQEIYETQKKGVDSDAGTK